MRCAMCDVRFAMYDLRFAMYGVPPHGTTLRLRLVRCTPHCAPSSLVRPHTAASPCAGLLEFCPFGAAQGRCSSSRHHTAASPCALYPTLRLRLVRGYWDFAPSGLLKEILNSQFSILNSHRVLRRHHHIADAELEWYEAGLAEFDVRYLFAFVVGDDRDGLCLHGIPAAAHVIEQ